MNSESVLLLIVVNTAAWLVLHLGMAWLFSRVDPERFDPRRGWYRSRAWERSGRIWHTLFRVRTWKRGLPDGARLFKRGFRKKRLLSDDPAYLYAFARETCRAELTHIAVMLSSALFFLWNPPAVGAFMVLYGVAANLPFIIVQRANRPFVLGRAQVQAGDSGVDGLQAAPGGAGRLWAGFEGGLVCFGAAPPAHSALKVSSAGSLPGSISCHSSRSPCSSA